MSHLISSTTLIVAVVLAVALWSQDASAFAPEHASSIRRASLMTPTRTTITTTITSVPMTATTTVTTTPSKAAVQSLLFTSAKTLKQTSSKAVETVPSVLLVVPALAALASVLTSTTNWKINLMKHTLALGVAAVTIPTFRDLRRQDKSKEAEIKADWPRYLLAAGAIAGPSTFLMARTSLTIPWYGVNIIKHAVELWVLTVVVSTIRVKRRQAQMATSEWARYAKHPMARGRAIAWLIMQQAMYMLASKVAFGASRRQEIRNKAGTNFATGLLQLGPLYIKLGQIISCRKNLLGQEWIDALAPLQDQVPAYTGDEAMDLAYSTMEEENSDKNGKQEFDKLFSDFDATPLAAASLGQVHKAVLKSNSATVAVKIQRPYLRKIYDQDFKLLTNVAQLMDKMPQAAKNVGGIASSWKDILVDAKEILYREIDYRDEAANAIRFAEEFGLGLDGAPMAPTAVARNNETLSSAADWLRTPYVYQNVSNERLLVMEYVPSIKITDTDKLEKVAHLTDQDKIDLSDALARAYLRQFCSHGFFSADPHPGNLGVEPAGSNTAYGKPRLVMYDFGQAATVTKDQSEGILKILQAIVDMDVDRSIVAFQKMGVLVDNADLDQVRAKVAENYRTGKIQANRKKLKRKGYKFQKKLANSTTATATYNGSYNDKEVMSYFTMPTEYAFVGRAISQMDGVGKSLDPDFDFVSSAAPYIYEVKGSEEYVREEVAKIVGSFQDRLTNFQMDKIRWATQPENYQAFQAEITEFQMKTIPAALIKDSQ